MDSLVSGRGGGGWGGQSGAVGLGGTGYSGEDRGQRRFAPSLLRDPDGLIIRILPAQRSALTPPDPLAAVVTLPAAARPGDHRSHAHRAPSWPWGAPGSGGTGSGTGLHFPFFATGMKAEAAVLGEMAVARGVGRGRGRGREGIFRDCAQAMAGSGSAPGRGLIFLGGVTPSGHAECHQGLVVPPSIPPSKGVGLVGEGRLVAQGVSVEVKRRLPAVPAEGDAPCLAEPPPSRPPLSSGLEASGGFDLFIFILVY